MWSLDTLFDNIKVLFVNYAVWHDSSRQDQSAVWYHTSAGQDQSDVRYDTSGQDQSDVCVFASNCVGYDIDSFMIHLTVYETKMFGFDQVVKPCAEFCIHHLRRH